MVDQSMAISVVMVCMIRNYGKRQGVLPSWSVAGCSKIGLLEGCGVGIARDSSQGAV